MGELERRGGGRRRGEERAEEGGEMMWMEDVDVDIDRCR